jgi:hypothetical protein
MSLEPVDSGVDKEASNLMGALHIQEFSNDFQDTPIDWASGHDPHDNDDDDDHNHDYDEDYDSSSSDSDSNDQTDTAPLSVDDLTTNDTLLTPNIIFTPASPCTHPSGSPSPVHLRQITASQLGVPRVRKRVPTSSSAEDVPPFFRPPRPYQNSLGNSGVHLQIGCTPNGSL